MLLWNELLFFKFRPLADWFVVDDGSFAVMLTELIDSFNAFILSRVSPFGDFLVVVLHS